MARKRKKMKVEEAEVPLSSMIDVVFLLLIYFIVTQKPIIEETLLGCDMPSPGSTPPKTKPTLLTIEAIRFFPNLSPTDPQELNTYYLNQQRWKLIDPSAPSDIRRQLQSIAQDNPEQTVIINCGPNAAHQKLVRLLDVCSEVGLKNLNVVNDESIKFRPPARR